MQESQRRRGARGESERPGGRVAASVALEGPRGREAGREEATVSPALATELLRGEGRKTTGGGGLGQVAGLADWAGQVGCGKLGRFFVLSFYFCFFSIF